MPALPIIAIAATVAGTIGSVLSASAAAKQQQKAIQAQSSMAANQTTREKLQQVRQARIAAGAVQQAAETQGVGTSSAAQGGQGSIFSQANSNISFLDQQQYTANIASKALGRANALESQAAIFSGAASVGESIFSASGGFKK